MPITNPFQREVTRTMRIPRPGRLTQPTGTIPPHATGARQRTQTTPSAPLYGLPSTDYVPFRLPAEDPNLLTARAVGAEEALAADGGIWRGGRLVPMTLDKFEFERNVGQNLAMLADDGAEVTR